VVRVNNIARSAWSIPDQWPFGSSTPRRDAMKSIGISKPLSRLRTGDWDGCEGGVGKPSSRRALRAVS
jgi:hypothetical protein